MNIIIARNKAEFDKAAAAVISRQIKKKPDSVLGLATGSTPMGMYSELARMYEKGELDFSKVITFNLDEYIGLHRSHPQSYCYFMHENLFDKINIKEENVNLLDGGASDSQGECEEYEKKIKAVGGIDLQVLGMGHNGHLGFNEPKTPFESITGLVDLTPGTIKANSRFFESVAEVPRRAMSMGMKTILHAKSILFIVSGSEKAEVVAKALKGPVTPEIPASVLQLHPFITVVLDEEAAKYL
ncbi:MAG: glucosamine-6-phosphate deaminase [Clostridiales bacterium]|nr:glucosamine-6-phosphate deaminase [Clostridiales bacterium]